MYFKSLFNHLKIQRTEILHNDKDMSENYLPLTCKIQNLDHIKYLNSRNSILFECKRNSEGIINIFLKQKLQNEQFIAIITGFKGCGKSITARQIESYLWEQYCESNINIIPIILQTKNNYKTDELDLLEYILQESYSFTTEEIQKLKEQIQQKYISLVFIIDQFELENIKKMSITNFQNTWGNSKIIIMIKEFKINSQEMAYFSNNLSLQLQILPFSQEQTKEYLNLHFSHKLKLSIQNYFTFFKLSTQIQDGFVLSLLKIFKQNYETQWDGQLTDYQLTLIKEVIQNLEIIKDEKQIKELKIIIKEHLLHNWFPIKNQNYILKFKLDSLAQNPAILKILINISPQLDQHYQLETFDFYEDFFQTFLRQEQQLFYQQEDQQNYVNQQIQQLQNKYQQQIFGNNNQIFSQQNQTQNVSLLEDYLDSLSKAQDYFIAKLIYKLISLYPSELMFSDNDDYCLLLQQQNKNLIQHFILMVPEMFQFFGEIKFSQSLIQKGMQLFKQKFANDINIKQKLLNMIKASSVIDNYEQIAGNAFYVLKGIYPFIENQYFANIRITHSNLQNMIFLGCDFSGSTMNYVNISSTNFIGCGMNNVKWYNMMPSLMRISNEHINKFQIIHEEKILAIVSKEKLINFLYLKYGKKLEHPIKTKESINLIGSTFNGNILATCNSQNEILIWNIVSRKMLRRMKTGQKKTLQFNFSKTGKFLASQSAHQKIKVWDLKLNEIMVCQECKMFVFHPTEEYIVLFNEKYKILQYFFAQKEFKERLEGQIQGTKKIDFSTDGKHFFTITDYDITVWDWKNQQLLQTIWGHYQFSVTFSFNSKSFARSNQYCLEIFQLVNDKFKLKQKIPNLKKNAGYSISYSPKSHLLLILEYHTRINQKFYILDTKKMHFHDQSSSQNQFFQIPLKFSPDNNLIASGGKQLCLFDQKSRKFVNLEDEEYDKVQSLAFSKNGLMLAIAIQNSNVHIINLREGNIIAKFEQKCNFSQVIFSDDDQFLAIGSQDNQSKLWEFKKHKTILIPSTQSANQITFLGTKHLIAISDKKKFIHLNSIQNNKKLSKFLGSKKQIQTMKFSNQSQLLVVGGNEKDVILWNIFKQKLIRKMSHHQNCINSVSFSYDGKMIASGSDDNNIILWDNASGVVNKVLKGHKNSVLVVIFKEDEEILASGGIDMLIIIWNIKNDGQIIKIFEGYKSHITCLTFSPVDQILVSGGKDEQILFWDVNQLKSLKKLQILKKSIKFLAFSSDCKKLAICNEENLVSVLNIIITENNYSFSLLQTIDETFKKIDSLAFSPDCQSLVIGGNSFQLVQWNINTGELIRFELENQMNIIDLVFTKDGTVLAVSGDNFSIFLFNVKNFQLIKEIKMHQKQQSVLFSPEDTYLVSSSKEIISWNTKTFEQKYIIQNNQKNKDLEILGFILDGKILVFVSKKQQIQKINLTLFQSGEILKSIVINGLSHILSPDGINIAVLKNKSQIQKLQINSQKLQNQINKGLLLKKYQQKNQLVANLQNIDLKLENDQIKLKKFKKHLDKLQSIQSIASTQDGQYFSTLGQNGVICLWQTFSGQFISQIHKGDQNKLWKMQFSPSDNILLFYSLNEVFCYFLEVSEKRCLFQKYQGKFHLIIFSQSDNLIATLYSDIQDYIILWNLQEEKPLLVIQDYSSALPSLSFSPDGQSIVSGSIDSSIYFLDVQTGEQTAQLDGMKEASKYLHFSKCGKNLISQEISNKLYLWNVDKQQLLRQFEPQQFQIQQFLFKSSDEIYLLGTQQQTIFFFALLNNNIISQFQSHSDIVQCIAISQEGENILFISKDSTIRIWNILEGKLMKKIESSKYDFISISSYDQKLIALENQDNQIQIWDTQMECLLQQLDGHTDKINVLVFSQDNNILVSGSSDNTVIVWNLQNVVTKKILRGHTDSVLSISISVNNKMIASGGRDKIIRIYKIDEGNHQIIFKGHNQFISCLQFSNDGNYLASGSYDCSVILWSVTQQQLIKIFKFHESNIISVKFSPKECFLISESEDETQITWNIKTGQFSSLKNPNQQIPLILQNQSLSIQKSSLVQAEIYSPNYLDIIQLLNNINN